MKSNKTHYNHLNLSRMKKKESCIIPLQLIETLFSINFILKIKLISVLICDAQNNFVFLSEDVF